ncbi:hypothetical protein [Nocardia paucivorans]|uniref:hypothetical protein n=1 Tax=Nocardia paucivorans TaxID=114259 RepID=UPI0012F9FF19|nr:hypothetical protein [Nocardia paucivorans]
MNQTPDPDARARVRLRKILEESLLRLHPDDLAEVMANPGIAAHRLPDGMWDYRGAHGRIRVAIVNPAILYADEEPDLPEMVRGCPDDASELFDDDDENDPRNPR